MTAAAPPDKATALQRLRAVSPLARFVIRRLIAAVPLIFAVIIFSFVLIQIAPGDPALIMIGDFAPSDAQLAALRQHLGLDQPVYMQLFQYVFSVLGGDLGYSYAASAPVIDLILGAVPATLILMVPSLLVFSVIGVAVGVFVASRPYSVTDNTASFLSVLGYSMPVFWLGQLMLLLFAFRLGWLPSQGMRDFRASSQGLEGFLDLLAHLALPAIVLGARYLAINTRLARASMIEALAQDYVTKARAQGLPNRVVKLHALRNAILPVVTMLGINFADVLTGTVLVEIVFGWPGLGRLTYDAIFARDYPLLMGLFLMVSIGVVLINAVTDILYGLVDPRVRQ